jgi:hypothetical protein
MISISDIVSRRHGEYFLLLAPHHRNIDHREQNQEDDQEQQTPRSKAESQAQEKGAEVERIAGPAIRTGYRQFFMLV